MFKIFRNLYLWFIHLFIKRMTKEELYAELIQIRNTVFDNIAQYLETEASKGYLKLVNRDDENNIIEFKIGQFRFLFQSVVQLSEKRILYKTFQRVLNLDYYPDSILYSQREVNELNIFGTIGGRIEFETPKSSAGSFDRARVNYDVKYIELRLFGSMLIEQADKWVNQDSTPSI